MKHSLAVVQDEFLSPAGIDKIDIERILGKLSNKKANPKDILSLANSLLVNSKIKKII